MVLYCAFRYCVLFMNVIIQCLYRLFNTMYLLVFALFFCNSFIIGAGWFAHSCQTFSSVFLCVMCVLGCELPNWIVLQGINKVVLKLNLRCKRRHLLLDIEHGKQIPVADVTSCHSTHWDRAQEMTRSWLSMMPARWKKTQEKMARPPGDALISSPPLSRFVLSGFSVSQPASQPTSQQFIWLTHRAQF